MAGKAPNDHRDPYWSELSSATEEKLGLPAGLLNSIVTRGERSNNDQVSEAGAKSPYQIIPATRKAVLDKYGVDAYLSPQNAAEAAGLLLKESLDRNDGDVASAVSEYHGGTDKANWGPKTRAYVGRVISGQRQAQQPQPESTFQRVKQSMQPAVSPDAIAQVYQAYQSGQMSPEERAEFESDVGSGVVMLPSGAVLDGQQSKAPTEKPAPVMLPPEVADAYATGKMSEQERADLEADIQAGLVQLTPNPGNLPDFQDGVIVPDQPGVIERSPEPTLGQQAAGVGETALAMGTGATTGQLGMIGGTLRGLAEQLLSGNFGTQQAADAVEQAAITGAEGGTYAPRTQQGQRMTQAVGEAVAPLAAIAPFTAEVGAIARGAQAAAPAVGTVAGQVAAPIQRAGARIASALKPTTVADDAAAGGARSGGAAAVEAATLRQARADELPVPMKLTEGMKTKDFEQQRFERETAKSPEMGEPIRERISTLNEQIGQNFDSFIDATGAEAGDLRSVGQSVDKAIRSRAARDKLQIREQYKAAREAGDMAEPVNLQSVIDHLNDSAAEATTAPLLKTVRDLAIKLKIAKDEGGVLVPVTEAAPKPGVMRGKTGPAKVKEPDLNTTETFRQAINRNTGYDAPNVRQATILKELIDGATDGKGGPLYRKARSTYAKYKKDYENIGLVKNLIGKKRGSSDRTIALEDVARRSIIDPGTSLDDVRQVRRLLQTEGQAGQQAWKELQGATLTHLKDEAFKNVARDSRGNSIVSPAQLDRAIQKLDKNGKLDFVFGKKGGELLRTINEVAKDVIVVAPGAVNTSNTASVLAGLMDVAISGTAGIPAPIMTGYRALTNTIKDRKTRARVRAALGLDKKGEE